MYDLGMRLVESCFSREKLIGTFPLFPPIPPSSLSLSLPLSQAHRHVLSGYYPCSEEDAIYLAGVTMQVQMAMAPSSFPVSLLPLPVSTFGLSMLC